MHVTSTFDSGRPSIRNSATAQFIRVLFPPPIPSSHNIVNVSVDFLDSNMKYSAEIFSSQSMPQWRRHEVLFEEDGFIGTQTHLPPKFSFSSDFGYFIQ